MHDIATVPPDDYVTAGLLNVVGGALNAGGSFVAVMINIWCCGIGVVWLVPMVIGMFQVSVGWRMALGKRVEDSQAAGLAGLIGSALSFNMWGLAASVIAFVMVQNDDVRGWLDTEE